MREIEVKLRIRESESLASALAKRGCMLGAPAVEEDVVYVRSPGDLATFLSNDVFLRIRVQNGTRATLTVKKDLGNLVKMEHESEVADADEMRNILELLGYREAVRVKKVRRKGSCEGGELCLDEVEGLGAFVEMERLDRGEGDPAAIQEEMIAFLSSVGADTGARVSKGYDILMLERRGG